MTVGYASEGNPATISDFRLDTYEITVGRFRAFVAAYSQDMISAGAGTNPNNPADRGWDPAWNANLPSDAAALKAAVSCDRAYQTWSGAPGPNEALPMNCIDWYESFAFCIWDGGRLPTEAEWNYAAAGGSEQRVFPWGSAEPGANTDLAVHGCYYNANGTCSGVSNIARVGSPSAGNGRWGHADLAGNLWEWTLDWLANPYGDMACVDCANTTDGAYRAIRGGSFDDAPSRLLSSYRLDRNRPTYHNYLVGSRCARMP